VEPVPTHIVVTCPNCGFGNVFRQPHPYHAGIAAQGFLYSGDGHRTLTWSSYDPEYAAVVGKQHPWALPPEDRKRLEERLTPAPDGSRWLFSNPARCLQCGYPISGPITDTIYYLRYDGSVDRDLVSSGGLGIKDVLVPRRPTVPWSTRDVWPGVLAAVLIIAVSYGILIVLATLSLELDIDLWVGLVPTLLELLLLIPVWWFSVRKYHASLRTLGFVGFRPSVLGVGLALLFGVYMFNGVYAYLLDGFGLRVQTDLTPVVNELSTVWPLFFATVVVAPVTEEIFFRGFVFAGLRSRYDWRWAAAISSVLFAAAHLQLTFFIPAFLLGYLFAFLYQRSDSIWPGLILHTVVNALAMSLTFLLA
jgi:membrane protease YdiL (CAAX protease family)